MLIELIAAVAGGNVIGYKGKMPWGRLPLDLARFRSITEGQTIVVGYNTLVSIGKELPRRRVLVLTHDPHKLSPFPWCEATTVDAVLEMAKTRRVIIAGGEEVYRQFLPYAKVAHITRIEGTFNGDVRFPELSTAEWDCSKYSSFHYPSSENPYPIRFEVWYRKE